MPATKTARIESLNAAPATKTARIESRNAAPARKTARTESLNAAPATKAARTEYKSRITKENSPKWIRWMEARWMDFSFWLNIYRSWYLPWRQKQALFLTWKRVSEKATGIVVLQDFDNSPRREVWDLTGNTSNQAYQSRERESSWWVATSNPNMPSSIHAPPQQLRRLFMWSELLALVLASDSVRESEPWMTRWVWWNSRPQMYYRVLVRNDIKNLTMSKPGACAPTLLHHVAHVDSLQTRSGWLLF